MPSSPLKNILFVSAVGEPRGTSAYTHSLVQEVSSRGLGVSLIALEGPMVAEYEKLGVDLHVLPKLDKPRSPFFPKHELAAIAEQAAPQIVHITSQHALGAGVLASHAAGAPAVVTVHIPLERRSARKALMSVAGVIAVSQAVREDLVNHVHVPREMVRVIPNGLDLSRFKTPEPRAEGRVPVIATAGALERVKAQCDFLAAARRILDSGRNAQFLIIGDGPEEANLRQQAADLGLQKHVTFVTGVTDHRRHISSCDIFVMPSLMEGLGLFVLQAMAFAKPVVSTNAGGLCLIVRDGETGLVVNRNDPESMAAAVIWLLEHPELARRLGASARRFVEAEFSLTACVDKTLAYFQEIIEISAGDG